MKPIIVTTLKGSLGLGGARIAYVLSEANDIPKFVTAWVGGVIAIVALVNLLLDLRRKWRHRND